MNESVMKRIESIEKELSILKQEVQENEWYVDEYYTRE